MDVVDIITGAIISAIQIILIVVVVIIYRLQAAVLLSYESRP